MKEFLQGIEQKSRNAPSDVVVMKFGGTSVENAAAIRRVAQIVRSRLGSRPVVVVSALSKVTDRLLLMGKAAARGDLETAMQVLQELRQRHQEVALDLVHGADHERVQQSLTLDFEIVSELIRGIAAVGEFSPRTQDSLLGFGECLSSKIASAAFIENGLNVALVDAHDCIVTDTAHTQATPLWDQTNEHLARLLTPLLEAGQIPLLGGFIGATCDGIPTTLGRGGSDFSAAIVGAGLNAERIEIWTDVDGIMTSDPNVCPDALRIERMSFAEAAELAYFGAKVLHPATLLPAMRQNIPVYVLNSRNPDCEGTEIVAQCNGATRVKAITVKRGVAVVDVEAVRRMEPELLREICEMLGRHQCTFDLVSASWSSASLLGGSTLGLPAVAAELKGLASVRWENHKALVCLVGDKIRRPEIAGHVFKAISHVDARMIGQGASERNISFLVDESIADESVRVLHQLFFSSDVAARAASKALCQASEAWR